MKEHEIDEGLITYLKEYCHKNNIKHNNSFTFYTEQDDEIWYILKEHYAVNSSDVVTDITYNAPRGMLKEYYELRKQSQDWDFMPYDVFLTERGFAQSK